MGWWATCTAGKIVCAVGIGCKRRPLTAGGEMKLNISNVKSVSLAVATAKLRIWCFGLAIGLALGLLPSHAAAAVQPSSQVTDYLPESLRQRVQALKADVVKTPSSAANAGMSCI